MPLRALSPLLALFLSSCANMHAGAYFIDPAPEWKPRPVLAPTPSPVALAEPNALTLTASSVAASPTPAPKRRKGGPADTPTATPTETPTATLTPTQATGVYLAPFQDKRRNPEIWAGRSVYEKVVMEPLGSTLLAKAWHKRPFSHMSFFWHRQFGYAMGSSGYAVTLAEEPFAEEAAALVAAKAIGAQVLLAGQITRLNMVKKGADAFLGTNFSGTFYHLNLELQLRAVEVATGRLLVDKKIEAQRTFFDPTRMGADDRNTFPRFFATGLPELALKVAGDERLLLAVGLPTFTHTVTSTQTPEVVAPKQGDAPTPEPTATPDTGPYWVNPKTGARVDPNWNFDPADGTPRKDFVLRQPEAKKTLRPTEPK